MAYLQTKDARENEDLYLKYREGDRTNWEIDAADSVAFINSVQWKELDAQALLANNQPALADNEVTPAINSLIAALTENSPRWNAIGREKSDPQTAQNISGLFEYIWYISKGNKRLKKAIKDYEVTGMGALFAYIDPNADLGKGEILITDDDSTDLYIDPNAKEEDSSDASNILRVKVMTREQIKILYPNFNFEGALQVDFNEKTQTTLHIETEVLQTTDQLYHEKYRLIDRYTKIKIGMSHIFDTSNDLEKILDKKEFEVFKTKPAAIVHRTGMPPQYVTKDSEVEKEMDVFLKTGGTFHFNINPQTQQAEMKPGLPDSQFSIPNSLTTISIVTMEDLIKLGVILIDRPQVTRVKRVFTIGGKEYYKGTLNTEHYPIVTFMLHHNRNPFPLSDVKLVRPLQEQLNKIDSLIIAYNTNITNVKVLFPKGSTDMNDVKARWGKSGTQVFEFDSELGGGAPIIVQLTQMSNALYTQRQILIAQIQRILGSYSMQDGQMEVPPQTMGGTLLLDEMSLRRTRSKKNDIEEALNQLARVVMDLIPSVYTERKIVRLLKPNHTQQEIVFNDKQYNYQTGAEEILNDLSVGRYDVICQSGSMLPTNRVARAQFMTGLFEKGILKDPTPILRESEIPDVEEIIQKQDQTIQLSQMLKQYEQYIKKLEGQIQILQRENINNLKRVEVSKFKSQLDKGKHAIQSQVDLTQQRLNDLVKNQKNNLNTNLKQNSVQPTLEGSETQGVNNANT